MADLHLFFFSHFFYTESESTLRQSTKIWIDDFVECGKLMFWEQRAFVNRYLLRSVRVCVIENPNRSQYVVTMTFHREKEEKEINYLLFICFMFGSWIQCGRRARDNYRSGVYIGLTCARNEFDNIFVAMFGCPMQCGLEKLKERNELEISMRTSNVLERARFQCFDILMSMCDMNISNRYNVRAFEVEEEENTVFVNTILRLDCISLIETLRIFEAPHSLPTSGACTIPHCVRKRLWLCPLQQSQRMIKCYLRHLYQRLRR